MEKVICKNCLIEVEDINYHEQICMGKKEINSEIKPVLSIDKLHEMINSVKAPYLFTRECIAGGETPKQIVDVKISDDGGLYMYLENEYEPIRGFPDQNTVQMTALYKRFIPLLLSSLFNQNWFQRIITLLSLRFNYNIFPQWLDYLFNYGAYLLKDEHYSQPVREVRRVLKGKLNNRIVDAIGLVLEYDSAYRYRFQDIFSNLDKSRPVIKELNRLLELIGQRDSKDMKEKFRKMKNALILLMILSPKIKRTVKDIFKDININEIKFSKEDNYWVNQIFTYEYKGMKLEDRKQENLIKYGGIK